LDATAHGAVERRFVRDVGAGGERLAAGGLDALHRLRRAFQRAVDDTDAGTLRGEALGAGAADAGATARDQGNLPLKPSRHRVLLLAAGCAALRHPIPGRWRDLALSCEERARSAEDG